MHHAFCAVCEPIFERGFIFDSYANRVGKGTHRAVARDEQFRDRHQYVLRCDIYRYFPAIDHALLKEDLRRRLLLHPRKTAILPTSEPASFLGYVLMPGGWRRLPEDNVRRFRNRLRGMMDRWRQGTLAKEDVQQRVRSWSAHATHANTWRLRQAIFRAARLRAARSPRPGSAEKSGRDKALAVPQPRFARRLLEQQTEEPPLREPQQEQLRQPQQQQRFPCGAHAQPPEPAAPRGLRASHERPGTAMMRARVRPSCPCDGGGAAQPPEKAVEVGSARRIHDAGFGWWKIVQ